MGFSRRPVETLDPAGTKAAVTALTTKILEISQFAHQRLDSELAGADRVGAYLPTLRARSAERIAKNADFAEMEKDRAQIRKNRESKAVSLNEAERRREKAENEARGEARKKDRLARTDAAPVTYELTLKNVSKPGLGEPMKNPKPLAKAPVKTSAIDASEDADESAPADDILLREAENILADYTSLLSREKIPVVTQR